MPESWIRKGREPSVPQEQMLGVRYLRYCPTCEDFKPQETVIDGHDRILRCTVCRTEERFILAQGVLVPEGTLPLLKAFSQRRVKEVLKDVQ